MRSGTPYSLEHLREALDWILERCSCFVSSDLGQTDITRPRYIVNSNFKTLSILRCFPTHHTQQDVWEGVFKCQAGARILSQAIYTKPQQFLTWNVTHDIVTGFMNDSLTEAPRYSALIGPFCLQQLSVPLSDSLLEIH